MSKPGLKPDRHQAEPEGLAERLKSLDTRIARMRELHATSGDALALKLIDYSLAERAEVIAKMPKR